MTLLGNFSPEFFSNAADAVDGMMHRRTPEINMGMDAVANVFSMLQTSENPVGAELSFTADEVDAQMTPTTANPAAQQSIANFKLTTTTPLETAVATTAPEVTSADLMELERSVIEPVEVKPVKTEAEVIKMNDNLREARKRLANIHDTIPDATDQYREALGNSVNEDRWAA